MPKRHAKTCGTCMKQGTHLPRWQSHTSFTKFVNGRALAAEEYSRKLQRIQKSKLAKEETGKVKLSLQTAQEDAQTEAQQFQHLAQTIRVELGAPLAEFITKQREARKLVNQMMALT
jgi:hypothetical protein